MAVLPAAGKVSRKVLQSLGFYSTAFLNATSLAVALSYFGSLAVAQLVSAAHLLTNEYKVCFNFSADLVTLAVSPAAVEAVSHLLPANQVFYG